MLYCSSTVHIINTRYIEMHCEDIWNIYPIYNGVGVAVFTIGIIYYCNAMLTVWWIHSQRGKALDGDEMAAKYVRFILHI